MIVFFQLEPPDTFNIFKTWQEYIYMNGSNIRLIGLFWWACLYKISSYETWRISHTWSSTRESAGLIYIKCHFIDKQSPECLQNWAPQRSEPPPAPRLLPDQSALIQSIKISIKSLGWSRLQTNDYLTTLTTSIPHNVRVLGFSVGLIKLSQA